MKIAYVAFVRLPTERAHGYAIMKMCEEFARAGHDVSLITPDKHIESSDDPFSYYGIESIFRHVRLASSDLLGRSERWGRFPLSYWLDLYSFVLALRKHAVKEIADADVVYTRDIDLVRYLPKHTLAFEAHAVPERRSKEALRAPRSVIAISNGLREEIEKRSGRKDVVVAPDAVDLERFRTLQGKEDARKELGLPEGPTALYAGHFYGWKGAEVFAEAARLLPETIHAVLVGGVDEDFERLSNTYGSPHIHIYPFQKQEKLRSFLAAADVCVLPNRSGSPISERYTSPLKLFEYMATGKPIIASDLPSIREIIDEDTALLVPPNDPALLAEGIQSALNDMPRALALAARAKEKVSAYSWKSRAAHILASVSPVSRQ